MQEIHLAMILALALSGLGSLLAFTKGIRERKELLRSVPVETTESIIDDEKSPKEVLSGPSLVMVIFNLNPFVLTLVLSLIVIVHGTSGEIQNRIASGGLLGLGITALFVNLGRYSILDELIHGLNEERGGSVDDFGRYIVIQSVFQPPNIYALLTAVLGLLFAGVLGGEPSSYLTIATANRYFIGSVILGISASSTVLMARGFKKIEGPINCDMKVFQKKLINTVLPHVINIGALSLLIWIMVDTGLLVS